MENLTKTIQETAVANGSETELPRLEETGKVVSERRARNTAPTQQIQRTTIPISAHNFNLSNELNTLRFHHLSTIVFK